MPWVIQVSRPNNCPDCQKLFLDRPLLQAEMRHIALTEGPAVATMELNDRLEEEHAEHEQVAADRQLRKEREAKWRGYG